MIYSMLKFIFYSIFIFQLFVTVNIWAQRQINIKDLRSNFAKGENKEKYYTKLIKNVEHTFNTLAKQNIDSWITALRDAQSILLANESVKEGLANSLNFEVDSYRKLQRTSLEVAYTLYSKEFQIQIENIFQNTHDPLSFILSAHYLINSNYEQRINSYYIDSIEKRFPDFRSSESLLLFKKELTNSTNSSTERTPNISDLLNHNFQNGKTIIYSFHRKNRKYPGLTIIKKPNGEFVKNSDGTLFNIPQLALSFSNLPYYISNGNTPQGIYSVVGWYISPTETIGPTPNILIRSPFEVTTSIFYHDTNIHTKWDLRDYKDLLPESWKNYDPIYQSYAAGRIGRRLIIIHGSTDETNYFKDLPYFPLTPTRGCLSSKEIWSEKTGICQQSDQVNLINAFKSTKQKNGFLVVLEIDNQESSVKLEEIEQFVKK